jgi:TonB family protein
MTKYYFFLLISFFSFISIHAQTSPEEMKKKNGKMTIHYHDTKTIQSQGEVHKHLKTGVWKNYDEKGRVTVSETYANGILDGAYVEYFSNGAVKVKGSYTNAIKSGQWEIFNFSNIKTKVENYDNKGNKIGVQESFDEMGRLQTYTVVDSLKNKIEYRYNTNGKLMSKQSYHNDSLEGLQYFYHYFGYPVDTLPWNIIDCSLAKKESVSKFYKYGHLIKLENLKNDLLEGCAITWNENEIIQDSTFYSFGRKNGYSYQYKNGKIISRLNYKSGMQVGEQIYYYDNGQPKSIQWWKYSWIDSTITFYPSGNRQSLNSWQETYHSMNYKFWSENKIEMLSYTSAFGKPATNVIVHADNGTLLKPKTVAYNNQVKKYLPDDFSLDEKTGMIQQKKIQDGQALFEGDDQGPPDVSIDQRNQETVYQFAEVMPSFPAPGDFTSYIQKNTKYPQLERDAGKTGTVYVQFVVEKDGSITNEKIVKSGGSPGFDKEALRVVSLMPKWNCGKMNGKEVRVQVIEPIKFVLN